MDSNVRLSHFVCKNAVPIRFHFRLAYIELLEFPTCPDCIDEIYSTWYLPTWTTAAISGIFNTMASDHVSCSLPS